MTLNLQERLEYGNRIRILHIILDYDQQIILVDRNLKSINIWQDYYYWNQSHSNEKFNDTANTKIWPTKFRNSWKKIPISILLSPYYLLWQNKHFSREQLNKKIKINIKPVNSHLALMVTFELYKNTQCFIKNKNFFRK